QLVEVLGVPDLQQVVGQHRDERRRQRDRAAEGDVIADQPLEGLDQRQVRARDGLVQPLLFHHRRVFRVTDEGKVRVQHQREVTGRHSSALTRVAGRFVVGFVGRSLVHRQRIGRGRRRGAQAPLAAAQPFTGAQHALTAAAGPPLAGTGVELLAGARGDPLAGAAEHPLGRAGVHQLAGAAHAPLAGAAEHQLARAAQPRLAGAQHPQLAGPPQQDVAGTQPRPLAGAQRHPLGAAWRQRARERPVLFVAARDGDLPPVLPGPQDPPLRARAQAANHDLPGAVDDVHAAVLGADRHLTVVTHLDAGRDLDRVGEGSGLPLAAHHRADPFGAGQIAGPGGAARLLPLPATAEHAVADGNGRTLLAFPVAPFAPAAEPASGRLAAARSRGAAAVSGLATAGASGLSRMPVQHAAFADHQPLDRAARRRLAARELDAARARHADEEALVRFQADLDAGAGGWLVDDEEPLPVVALDPVIEVAV